MKHIFIKGNKDITLLLLHGTGGNEHDLLPIGKQIDPEANILSVRGQILENGMPRFFKRLKEGVFDEEDLIFRTHELKTFMDYASKHYDFDQNQVVGFGFSNGANILGSMLFHYEKAFKGAILSHPMVPIRHISLPNLKDVSIFIGASTNDPLVSEDETNELYHLFLDAHAQVKLHLGNDGHRLSQEEMTSIKAWYQSKF